MQQMGDLQHYLEKYPDDSFDILSSIKELVRRWKIILIITLVGGGFSLLVALIIAKEYHVDLILSVPSEADIVQLNQNGLTQRTPEQVFKMLYDRATSNISFFNYIRTHQLLGRFFPDVTDLKENEEVYLAKLGNKFANSVLQKKKNDNDNFLSKISSFSLGLNGPYEGLYVETLNNYVPFVSEHLLNELKSEEKDIIDLQLQALDKKIELAKQGNKRELNYEITKMEENNKELLAKLNQKKRLLIQRTKDDRVTNIAKIEAQNSLKMDQLNQRRVLLLVKAKQDKETSIAEAKEALKIASALGIVYPTPLEELKQNKSSNGTNINLTNVQQLPLYLMGSNYLNTMIKTLEERKDESQFLKELHALDMDLAMVRDDKNLAQLKAMKSDEKYLEQLNAINEQIELVLNDQKLKALKERTTDDPYVSGLSGMLNDVARLKSLSLDFSNVNTYIISRSALLTGKAIKPNRSLIVILGSLISLLIGTVYVLLASAIRQREQKTS